MTDSEYLQLAESALPDELKGLPGTVVRRMGANALHESGSDEESRREEETLLAEMERLLETKLSPPPVQVADSADVAFHEETPLGRRTTVIQIRGGAVTRKIGQA